MLGLKFNTAHDNNGKKFLGKTTKSNLVSSLSSMNAKVR